MLLFRKMLHCNDGLWLACVPAEKLTEVRFFAVSLFIAGAALAQNPQACEPLLKAFGERLAAAGVAQNDPRALEARSRVQDDCEAGNLQAAEAELDRAAAELGAPVLKDPDSGGKAEPETGTEQADYFATDASGTWRTAPDTIP